MKIGKLVQNHIGKILRYCEGDPGELSRLMDAAYSRDTFKLNWPFCAEDNKITLKDKDEGRYWSSHSYSVNGKQLLFCSQWYERNRNPFYQYVLSKGIIDQEELTTLGDVGEPTPTRPTPSIRKGTENRRYGSRAIGNAQNAVIRFILSNLGEERFDETDWEDTKIYFSNGCAYCPDGGIEHMDHGIPINKTDLGEHRLGNLIPSCRKCNADKHYADFRSFLGDKAERIEKIESYMVSRNYTPLGNNAQIKKIIEEAHSEVRVLVHRYITIIEAALAADLAVGEA